jgi:chromosome partitioning protein
VTIIALVGNKGGAGKTTLAVNIASLLGRSAKTAVFDADPQGSSLQWRAIAEDPDGLPVVDAIEDLPDALARRGGQFEHVLIDCPPSVDAVQTLEALCLSDLALIPVQPSPLDLWATVHIDHAIERSRQVNPGLAAYLVINQLEPWTRLSRLVRRGVAELGLPAAERAIRRRAIYRASILEGKSVLEMGRGGQAAAEELKQLINEVILP